jgi:acetyltransferase-like isoleucine patch superfamily enzyme
MTHKYPAQHIDIGILDTKFGKNVTLVGPINLYGSDIGDDVFIGPFVEIQNEVKIGSGSRIQSHAFICELVTIGCDCFVSHGVMFVNDLFSQGGPSRGRKDSWKPTKIGDRVSIGTNATVLPVNICSDTVIGAGAVVTADIDIPGFYVGNPARLLRKIKD